MLYLGEGPSSQEYLPASNSWPRSNSWKYEVRFQWLAFMAGVHGFKSSWMHG